MDDKATIPRETVGKNWVCIWIKKNQQLLVKEKFDGEHNHS